MKLEPTQVAVVTGAASGIGLGIAQAFALRGLHLVLADVEREALVKAEVEIGRLGASVMSVLTDVRNPEEVDRLATEAAARFGRIDIVVSNAGVATRSKAAWEMDHLDWKWVLDVNLYGAVNCIRAFVPRLIAQGSGHMAFTASIGGLTLVPYVAPYTASKRAVVGVAESLHAELIDRSLSVGVSILCPSYVPSRISDADRNRPPELALDPTDAVEGALRDYSSFRPVEPQDVGDLLVKAIEEERLYVLTHEESVARIHRWIDGIFAECESSNP